MTKKYKFDPNQDNDPSGHLAIVKSGEQRARIVPIPPDYLLDQMDIWEKLFPGEPHDQIRNALIGRIHSLIFKAEPETKAMSENKRQDSLCVAGSLLSKLLDSKQIIVQFLETGAAIHCADYDTKREFFDHIGEIVESIERQEATKAKNKVSVQ